MVKIGICLPIYGSIPSNSFINFINFLHDLFVNGRNWDIQIFMKPNMTIDKARNDLVKVALESKCDYIFFIDSKNLQWNFQSYIFTVSYNNTLIVCVYSFCIRLFLGVFDCFYHTNN